MGGVDGAGAGGVGKQPRRVYKEHIISGHRFFVEDCYTDLKPIGGGSYGLVCSAVDKRTGEPVAIKKVAELFKDLIDAKRILREIKLLRKFGGHENITSLLDISVDPPMSPNFKDMYIVTELFECDLDRIVSSSQALSNGHAQYVSLFPISQPPDFYDNLCSIWFVKRVMFCSSEHIFRVVFFLIC